METIKEEEKKKSEEAKNEHQAMREEIRTKISEDNNTMKTQLDSRYLFVFTTTNEFN